MGRRDGSPDPLALIHSKSDDEFVREHLEPSLPPDWARWTHPRTGVAHVLRLVGAPRLSAAQLDGCLGLVERTSGPHYRASAAGWRPGAKRREMRSPDMRYLLVEEEPGGENKGKPGPQQQPVRGFASMLPTWEDGLPVLYCYELHLEEDLRGTGLGAGLMELVLAVGRAMPPVTKVMLTCFSRNERALAFYHRLGFGTDACSPTTRTLRGGRSVAPDYVILSRSVRPLELA